MSAGRIDVYWFECGRDSLPPDDRWLSEEELLVLRSFRIPKRREDWRLGRWITKQAVAASLAAETTPSSLACIIVRPAGSGAPEVFLPDGPAPLAISITHSNGLAACAVSAGGAAIGCDLEVVEPRSEAFLADYFLEKERALVAGSAPADRGWLTTLLWSTKESALKALHEGLRLDTRSVHAQPVLDPPSDGWRPVRVSAANGHEFQGWWRSDGLNIRTVVSDPSCNPPLVREVGPPR